MKSKVEIYALAICFAAMVCLVISGSVAGYSIFEIAAPEITMPSYNYERYQTNEAYWQSKRSCCSKDQEQNEPKPSDETLTKQRLDGYAIEIKSQQRSGFQALIKSLMYILVSGITLFIHWK